MMAPQAVDAAASMPPTEAGAPPEAAAAAAVATAASAAMATPDDLAASGAGTAAAPGAAPPPPGGGVAPAMPVIPALLLPPTAPVVSALGRAAGCIDKLRNVAAMTPGAPLEPAVDAKSSIDEALGVLSSFREALMGSAAAGLAGAEESARGGENDEEGTSGTAAGAPDPSQLPSGIVPIDAFSVSQLFLIVEVLRFRDRRAVGEAAARALYGQGGVGKNWVELDFGQAAALGEEEMGAWWSATPIGAPPAADGDGSGARMAGEGGDGGGDGGAEKRDGVTAEEKEARIGATSAGAEEDEEDEEDADPNQGDILASLFPDVAAVKEEEAAEVAADGEVDVGKAEGVNDGSSSDIADEKKGGADASAGLDAESEADSDASKVDAAGAEVNEAAADVRRAAAAKPDAAAMAHAADVDFDTDIEALVAAATVDDEEMEEAGKDSAARPAGEVGADESDAVKDPREMEAEAASDSGSEDEAEDAAADMDVDEGATADFHAGLAADGEAGGAGAGARARAEADAEAEGGGDVASAAALSGTEPAYAEPTEGVGGSGGSATPASGVPPIPPDLLAASIEKSEKLWLRQYRSLSMYRDMHGHTRVPSAMNNHLSRFVIDHRVKHRLSTRGVGGVKVERTGLTEERIRLLDGIGFEWSIESDFLEGESDSDGDADEEGATHKRGRMQTWWEQFANLLRYRRDVGDPTATPGRNAVGRQALYNWCEQNRACFVAWVQRRKAKPSYKFTAEKAAALMEVGFPLEPRSFRGRPKNSAEERARARELKWWDHLAQLEAYKGMTGDTDVKATEDKQLYRWVRAQRTQYNLRKKGMISSMTDQREAALEGLGFIWVVRRGTTSSSGGRGKKKDGIAGDRVGRLWKEKLKELTEYKKKHGTTLITNADCTEDKSLRSLYIWTVKQRAQYNCMKKGMASFLTPERIRALNKLEFVWNNPHRHPPRPIGTAAPDYQGPGGEASSATAAGEAAPATAEEELEGLEEEEVPPSREEKLRAVWFQRLAELTEYKRIHGTTIINTEVMRDRGPLADLCRWCQRQRGEYHKLLRGEHTRLDAERVRSLEAIGFHWYLRIGRRKKVDDDGAGGDAAPVDPAQMELWLLKQKKNRGRVKTWWESYADLKAYYDEHGTAHISKRVALEEGPYKRLAIWTLRQRQEWSRKQRGLSNTLGDEKIRALEELGFTFRVESRSPRVPYPKGANPFRSSENPYPTSGNPYEYPAGVDPYPRSI